MGDNRILLGVIGRPHGVRGLVRVTSHTADPTDLTAYGPLTDAKGRRFALRWRGEGVAEVTELVGDQAVKVMDRDAAARLTNTQLFVDRAQLPAAADEDEFYLTDLIGLAALDPAGMPLGLVTVVHDYGAGASLEIDRPGAPALLVPFTKACVPEVDLAARRVVVVMPDVVTAAVDAQADMPDSPASPRGLEPRSGSRMGEGGQRHLPSDSALPLTPSREGTGDVA